MGPLVARLQSGDSGFQRELCDQGQRSVGPSNGPLRSGALRPPTETVTWGVDTSDYLRRFRLDGALGPRLQLRRAFGFGSSCKPMRHDESGLGVCALSTMLRIVT